MNLYVRSASIIDTNKPSYYAIAIRECEVETKQKIIVLSNLILSNILSD